MTQRILRRKSIRGCNRPLVPFGECTVRSFQLADYSMQLRFLGACQEVGRSAFAVKTGNSQILMDYGVMINHDVSFPVHISPKDLDAVILTHAHLDHSGLIPLFYLHPPSCQFTESNRPSS